MKISRSLSALCFIFGVGAAANASPVNFLATDGNKLYRADSSGNLFGSVTMSAAIQSLTWLPEGVNLPGASAGDIIACATTAVNGRYRMYRLDDPLGAATLTQIGSLGTGVGSLVFANGEMWGVEDSLNPIRIIKLDPSTGNSITTYNTGVAVGGSGGLSFSTIENQFYFTDATNHRLYRWAPGGSASLVGSLGFAFSNNGLEYHDGRLYGAFRRDTPANTMSIGTIDTTSGAFTAQATLTGILGNGTGFLAVPEPGSMSALLLGAGLMLRRRTKR